MKTETVGTSTTQPGSGVRGYFRWREISRDAGGFGRE